VVYALIAQPRTSVERDGADIRLPDLVTGRVAHTDCARLVVYEIDHEWISTQDDLALADYLTACCIHPRQKEQGGLNERTFASSEFEKWSILNRLGCQIGSDFQNWALENLIKNTPIRWRRK
jgi:hypothetical protein